MTDELDSAVSRPASFEGFLVSKSPSEKLGIRRSQYLPGLRLRALAPLMPLTCRVNNLFLSWGRSDFFPQLTTQQLLIIF